MKATNPLLILLACLRSPLGGVASLLLLWGDSNIALSDVNQPRATQAGSASGQVGLSGGGRSSNPAFSADGRFVVFVSQARNLVTNDSPNMNLGVYRCELSSGMVSLVSVGSTGEGGADADAWAPAITSDGRRIAFASGAGNLDGLNPSSPSDIFVFDALSGRNQLVTVSRWPQRTAHASYPGSRHPLVSADGRQIFFESTSQDLTPEIGNGKARDIFVRDMAAGTNRLVSVTTNGTGAAAGPESGVCGATLHSITPDGTRVVFATDMPLVPEAGVSGTQLYVRDLRANLPVWIGSNAVASYASALAAAGCPSAKTRSFSAALSADGRYVAFKTAALPESPGLTNVLDVPVFLFRHDMETGETTLIAGNANEQTWPRISADGRYVAWDDRTNVFRWDGVTASNTLVSVSLRGTEPGPGVSKAPVMSPDGRFVVFVSAASNLTSEAGNGLFQVYWRDLQTQDTRLVTVNRHGQLSGADHEFIEPDVTADGREVAFESDDDDLVPGDFNRATDVFARDMATGSTVLISLRHPTRPCVTAAAHAVLPCTSCLSADGRLLAFTSSDSNVAPDDTNGWASIFVRDFIRNSSLMVAAELCEVTPSWASSLMAGGPVISPIVSANGRYLVLSRPNSVYRHIELGGVYRLDLWSSNGSRFGSCELVNQCYDGLVGADAPAQARGISADGRLVLFLSRASDLVPQPGPGTLNVFLRDMEAGTNQLVSVNIGGGYAGADCVEAWLSSDGTKVAFTSAASDLATNGTATGQGDLFVRDLVHNTTVQVSVEGRSGIGCSLEQRGSPFTRDPDKMLFTSLSGLVLRDLVWQTNLLVDAAGCEASISQDSRWVVYRTRSSASVAAGRTNQVYVYDTQSGISNLVSVACNGVDPANGNPGTPHMTPDGRYVVFGSLANNLVENDTNGVADLFMRDLRGKTTIALTRSITKYGTANGPSGNSSFYAGGSPAPNYRLSADGHTLVFESFASDLVPGDYNDKCDIFVLRIGSADSDGDGMDDDWEMAYFGKLDRDGLGDFDADGANDLAEFAAGTDPTNRGSVLRVFRLTSLSSNGTTLLWPAAPGKTYKAQYKDQLQATEWKDLPGPVTVNGSTATAVDLTTSGATQRFYRVLVE